jgi:hypothetical protein
VGGAPVANGFAIEIEDRGLGMSEADLAAANEHLAHPPEFNLTSTARLGLYVVGRLGERHGIKVRLRESPYGGTTAIVLIPSVLVVEAQHASVPRPRGGTGPMALAPGRSVDEAAPDDEPEPTPEPGPPDPVVVEPEPAAATPWPDPTPVPEVTAESGRHAEREQPLHLVDPAPPLPVRQRTADADPERTPDGVTYTPAGLPWRVRQASLAPPLRATAPSRPDAPAAEPDEAPARGPEEIRRMMASYQTGTLRGRSEAARRTEEQPADADPEPPVERG